MQEALNTQRLVLRQWQTSDYASFAEISADSKVMKYFPTTLSKTESEQLVQKIKTLIDKNGWGFWAVELKSNSELIGFVGLHYQDQEIPNTPFIEIGWRLSSKHWGKGYAPEAAAEALKFAFNKLNQTAVYAFTTIENKPSRRVMEKIGMVDTKQDFNHPKLDQGHPLERHCLYKITLDEWLDTYKPIHNLVTDNNLTG